MASQEPRYVIDTCSITEMRRVYPSDMFPQVWELIGNLADEGILISIDEVYEELKVQDDEVLEWAKRHIIMFKPLDGDVQKIASEILSTHPKLVDIKKRKSGADPFLIALGHVRSCSVVTEEQASGGAGRPKIPNVCLHYDVKCIKLLDLLRENRLH